MAAWTGVAAVLAAPNGYSSQSCYRGIKTTTIAPAATSNKPGGWIGTARSKQPVSIGTPSTVASSSSSSEGRHGVEQVIIGETHEDEDDEFGKCGKKKRVIVSDVTPSVANIVSLRMNPFPGISAAPRIGIVRRSTLSTAAASSQPTATTTSESEVGGWEILSHSFRKDEEMETTLEQLVAMRASTAHQLHRSYPHVDVGYDRPRDPTLGWMNGTQIVSVSYSSTDLSTWINEAKFMENGRCGYVLKPEWMMIPGSTWSKDNAREITITVISARQLPKIMHDVIDPYVQLRIYGPDASLKATHVISNNGWDPTWNEDLTFSLRIPELDVLVLTIMDSDAIGSGQMVGQAVINVPLLREGVRAVSLFNVNHLLLNDAHLLIKVKIAPLVSTFSFIDP